MDKEKGKQLIVKICCIIAAFGLWLYISNVENPIITYKVRNVPVELINDDSLSKYKLIVDDDREQYVNLMIKGNASEVYNITPKDFKVIADLSAYALKNGENRIPVEIKQSPDNISVVQNEDLWIKVALDYLTEKTVPVEIDIKGEARTGYYAQKAIIRPTDVVISGAAKYVNSVDRVYAEADINDAYRDLQMSLTLKAIDAANRDVDEVKILNTFVEVIVPVDKIKTVNVNTNTINKISSGLVLKSIEANPFRVSIAGDEEVVDAISSLETEIVDLSKITNDTTLEVPLTLPKNVKLIDHEKKVNVNIDVEKIITKDTSYTIKIENLIEEYQAELEQSMVSLTIQGEDSVVNELSYEDISASIDLANLKEGEYIVPINIFSPENISIASKNSEVVKVKIIKKEANQQTEKVIIEKEITEKQLEVNNDNTSE